MNDLLDLEKSNIANELLRGDYKGDATAAFFGACMMNNRRFVGTPSDLTAFLHEEITHREGTEAVRYCYQVSNIKDSLNKFGLGLDSWEKSTLEGTRFGSQARNVDSSAFLLMVASIVPMSFTKSVHEVLAEIQKMDVPDMVKTFMGAQLVEVYGIDFDNNDIIRTEIVKLAMAEKISELNHLYEEREALLRNANFDAVVIQKMTQRIQQLEDETKS